MTDQIELPPRAQTPPILSSSTPMSGRLIRFNTALPELHLNIQIRDEDTTEILRGRYRIINGNTPPRIPSSSSELDYECPERDIVGVPGTVEREEGFDIMIAGSRFMRGQCYRIDVAVSSSFKACMRYPELFDVTSNEDNEQDVGRASYWVWALSGNAITDKDMAMQLLESCPYDTYQPPNPSTPPVAVEK